MADRCLKRAALYVRVSTGAQATRDLSIPDQIRQLEKHCASQGWQVVSTFKDARTGTDANRPGFQDMLEATDGGKPPFDVIVVHSMSRFFRDEIEFELHARMLAKRGVRIVSITQEFDDSPLGEMVRRIMALFDEYDSKETGKHVARARKENALQGFYNGSPAPFGFEAVTAEVRGQTQKKLAPRAGEADTVRRIFDLYLNGDGSSGPMGVKKITEWLNDHGITTRRGARWGIGGVHNLLTDPVNKGEYWHNRKAAPEDRILVPVPNIVSMEVFDLVQRNLTERNPKKTPPRVVSGPILLTGLATCGKCGSGMLLSTGKGGQYRYYACGGRIRQGRCTCDGTRVRMEETDDLVLGAIVDKLLTVPRMTRLLEEAREKQTQGREKSSKKLSVAQQRLDDAEVGLSRLLQLIERGLMEPDDPTLETRIDDLRQQRDDAQAVMQSMLRNLAPAEEISARKIADFVSLVRAKLFDGKVTVRRAYLRAVVDNVEINENEIRVRADPRNLRIMMEKGTVPTFVRNWRSGRDRDRTFSPRNLLNHINSC